MRSSPTSRDTEMANCLCTEDTETFSTRFCSAVKLEQVCVNTEEDGHNVELAGMAAALIKHGKREEQKRESRETLVEMNLKAEKH